MKLQKTWSRDDPATTANKHHLVCQPGDEGATGRMDVRDAYRDIDVFLGSRVGLVEFLAPEVAVFDG